MSRSILLVEDSEAHAEIVQRAFESYTGEYSLTAVSTLQEAMEALDQSEFALVISDWHLPDGQGIELAKAGVRFPLLLMTSHGNEEMAVEAMKSGALDYVAKSETSLTDMPHIAGRAIRQWDDIVARKRVEEELRMSEAKFRALSNFAPVGIFYTDEHGSCLYTNPTWQAIAGMTLEQSLGEGWAAGVHPEDRSRVGKLWNESVARKTEFISDLRFLRPDSSIRWVVVRAKPIFSEGRILGYVGTDEDITERKEAEEIIRASLVEKEELIQEIHHRVKNNLQLINSLLQLQVADITDPQTLAVFQESQMRIQSMAMIHEKLYNTQSLAEVDLADYIRSLTSTLFQTYANQHERIELEVAASEARLSIKATVPVGLILNELITNSLKYAFPAGRIGKVRVELTPHGEDTLRLRVIDNGVGFPKGFRIEDSKSLGLRLVNRLAKQIRATMSWESAPTGTSVTLEFKDRFKGQTGSSGL